MYPMEVEAAKPRESTESTTIIDSVVDLITTTFKSHFNFPEKSRQIKINTISIYIAISREKKYPSFEFRRIS